MEIYAKENNFWKHLTKPFFMVAPLEDVTDAAFRAIIAKKSKEAGGTYVTFTEFTSADGLVHADVQGQIKLRAKLRFTEQERPIVAQLFTATPENMETVAKMVAEFGFDGVDINMGCPDRSVEKQGAGAALIKTPVLAKEIIEAAQKGVKAASVETGNIIPVSIKTRIGYDENELATWLPALLSTNPALITIHARTRKEMSDVPAHWECIKEAVAIRDSLDSSTLIAGNGDVESLVHARILAFESGADGIMLGRAVFGNPWVMSKHTPTLKEKIEALIEHTQLFEKEFTGIKSFATMRKHFGSYINGFDGAKELRVRLMQCEHTKDVEEVLHDFIPMC